MDMGTFSSRQSTCLGDYDEASMFSYAAAR